MTTRTPTNISGRLALLALWPVGLLFPAPAPLVALLADVRLAFDWATDPPRLHVIVPSPEEGQGGEVDVTDRLRDPDVTAGVSPLSTIGAVRKSSNLPGAKHGAGLRWVDDRRLVRSRAHDEVRVVVRQARDGRDMHGGDSSASAFVRVRTIQTSGTAGCRCDFFHRLLLLSVARGHAREVVASHDG